ncbi:hypothetical protein [Streptomyces sp. NPDC059092]|uniref:hypothetical protein n=1 Tax=Streptomyces sp. NPDC059092 TaxID=3346725 RepID=UPI0036C1E69F
MPPHSPAPTREEPTGGRATTAFDRMLTGLSLWWMASPVAFALWALVEARSRGSSWTGDALLWTCVGGVLVAPAAGLFLALAGRRRPARRRFALMCAVSAGAAVLLMIFVELAAECPDGYHC